MDPLAIQLIAVVICGIIASLIASNKGRSVVGWFFGGFFLGIIGIIVVAVLPNLKDQQAKEDRIERENRRLREQLHQERVKSESFRSHAQTRLDAHDGHLGVDTRSLAPPMDSDPQYLLGAESGDPGQAMDAMASGSLPGAVPPPPMPPMTRLWHYADDGRSIGPVDERELAAMFRTGRLDARTLVWTESLDDWRSAAEVPFLQPYLES